MTTKKLLLGLYALLLGSLVSASPLDRRELVLSNVSAQTATLTTPEQLLVGESGIVVRTFGTHEMVVVGRVVVASATPTEARVNILPYKGLEQPSLPTFVTNVQNGDKVILHPFGKRSLILSSSFEGYQKVVGSIKDGDFIHVDHFASYLKSRHNPLPKKEDIQRFCEEYSIEFLYLSYSNGETQMRECASLALLKTPTTQEIVTRSAATEEKLPFYHRVGEIKRGLFDFGASSIESFDPYFHKLFEEK